MQLAGRLAQMEWHNYSSSLNVTSVLQHIHSYFMPPQVCDVGQCCGALVIPCHPAHPLPPDSVIVAPCPAAAGKGGQHRTRGLGARRL